MKNDDLKELLQDLAPEELEPRLELQILIDPISVTATGNDNNCRDGGNCNAPGSSLL